MRSVDWNRCIQAVQVVSSVEAILGLHGSSKTQWKEEPIGKLMDVLSEGVLPASLDYPAAATNRHSFLSFLMSLNELQPISAESDAEAM
jgi:hypothetical protein